MSGARDPFVRLVAALEPWLDQIVVVGGWAHRLYRLHPQQASRHKSGDLDQISRRLRSLYCVHLLRDAHLQEKLRAGAIGLKDMELAVEKIALHATLYPTHEARDFRFMLAWMYQQLPGHGVLTWWRWTRIQKALGLALDRTYRLNTVLLAFLPVSFRRKYFDTLIKLKC